MSELPAPLNANGKLDVLGYEAPIGRLGLTRTAHDQVLAFGRQVRAAVQQASGRTELAAAKAIRTSVIAFAMAKLAQAKLEAAKKGKIALTEAEVMGWADRVVKFEQVADKTLQALCLPIRPLTQAERVAADWDAFYKQPALPSPSAQEPPGAAENGLAEANVAQAVNEPLRGGNAIGGVE